MSFKISQTKEGRGLCHYRRNTIVPAATRLTFDWSQCLNAANISLPAAFNLAAHTPSSKGSGTGSAAAS